MSALELKVPPVALVLLAAAAMWFVSVLAPSFSLTQSYRESAGVALALGLAGVAVALLGVVAFRRARTTVNPTTPQAATSLVCCGIYRYSRNPMYVGLLLALLGWAAFLGNALALSIAPAFVVYMNSFQIAPEERALTHAFGQDFTNYMRRVRRWL